MEIPHHAENTLELNIETLRLGELDISKVCSKNMDRLKFSNDNWYLCRETNLWAIVKKPHMYVVSVIQADITTLIDKCSDKKEIKELKKYYKDIAGSGYNKIYNYLQELLCDAEFVDKINNNIGYLSFKDGVIDLKTGIFRQGLLPSDYITYTIETNYPKNVTDVINRECKVWEELKKVLNNNGDHLDYFMSLIGHAFTGESHLVKSAYFMIDGSGDSRGDNGKTFIFNLIHQVMGDYVKKTKSSLLEKGNATVHKQLIGLKGKRLIFMEEFPEKELNPELFKELSDGGKIENEIMFGTTESINIIGMFFALSNHTPKIDSDETACYNRYKQVSFCSHFDRTGDRDEENPDELEYIADTKLGDELLENHRDELVTLIIQYALQFYKNGIVNIPNAFLIAQEETKNANDEFLEYFEENLSKTNCIDDKLALMQLIENSSIPKEKIKLGMKRMGFKYNKDLSGMGKDCKNKPYKGGYTHVRLSSDDTSNPQEVQYINTAGM